MADAVTVQVCPPAFAEAVKVVVAPVAGETVPQVVGETDQEIVEAEVTSFPFASLTVAVRAWVPPSWTVADAEIGRAHV